MTRFLRILVVTLSVAAGACTAQVRHDPFADYPNRENVHDVQFAWRTVSAADGVSVEGIAKNVRFPFMYDLELRLSLLGRENRVLAGDTFFFIPDPIAMDDWRPFRITLRKAPPQGAKLQFLYTYLVEENDDRQNWMNGFKADVASGAVMRESQ